MFAIKNYYSWEFWVIFNRSTTVKMRRLTWNPTVKPKLSKTEFSWKFHKLSKALCIFFNLHCWQDSINFSLFLLSTRTKVWQELTNLKDFFLHTFVYMSVCRKPLWEYHYTYNIVHNYLLLKIFWLNLHFGMLNNL